MSDKKKTLIIILLSLLVIVVVLAVVFVCQKEKEPAGEKVVDWTTYRNEAYGFEIDYPSKKWEIEEKYLGTPPSLLSFNLVNKEGKNLFLSFYIDGEAWPLFPHCENLSWREIMNNFYDCTGGGGIYTIDPQQEITSDSGVKGYEIKATDARGEMKGALFPIPEGLEWEGEKVERACIIFTYYLEPEPTPEEIEMFNRVVSSLRFIEE